MTGDFYMSNFKKKSILYPLIATGLILSLGQNIAFAEDTPSASEDDQAIQQKVKARLLEIDAEANLELVRQLDIRSTPTTLFIDAIGHEVGRAVGAPKRDQVLNAIAAIR